MKLREYLSVRYAYNIVRQETTMGIRLTFEEFAILCMLSVSDLPCTTSSIADYQGTIRPTMTHRLHHLATLGLIQRHTGESDRRNIVCSVTDDGVRMVENLAERTIRCIPKGYPFARSSLRSMICRVVAMGSKPVSTSDLVLLAMLSLDFRPVGVTELTKALGFLQPTMSMATASMREKGLIARTEHTSGDKRLIFVEATKKGKARANEVSDVVSSIVVRRASLATVGSSPAGVSVAD